MNKNLIIGIGVVILIIIGVTIFSGNNNNSEDGNKKNSGTIKEFMSGAMGNNISCDFSHEVGKNNELKVKTYIAGNKVRVDYQMKRPVPGGSSEWQNMYIISDGEYSYIWGDGPLAAAGMQGMKIKQEDYQEEEVTNEIPMGMPIDYETPLTNCKKWSVNDEMFEVPSDIQFLDPTNMLDFLPQGVGGLDIDINDSDVSESSGVPACSACDMLPVEQKDGCRQAIGC